MQQLDNISINFILSTGRTGSTLLSSMLNMHPEILSVFEEPFAYNLFPKYHNITKWDIKTIDQFCYDFFLFSEGKLEGQFGKKDDLKNLLLKHQSSLNCDHAIKLAYFAFFPNKDKSSVKIIVDKQLVFHHVLDKVASYYPNSKFIILHRDPRDNVLVKLKRAIKENKKTSLLILSKTWKEHYSEVFNKLDKLSSERFFHVKYEDLVTNPETTLRKITTFLNVNYNEAMLNYNEKIKQEINSENNHIGENVKNYISLIHDGLTKKTYTNKIGLWKTELTSLQNNIVWSICKDTAEKIGYQNEGCEKISYLNLSYLKDLIIFNIKKVYAPYLYHILPYIIKYNLKKIMHSKKLKNNQLISRYDDINSTTHKTQ